MSTISAATEYDYLFKLLLIGDSGVGQCDHHMGSGGSCVDDAHLHRMRARAACLVLTKACFP